ncbi:2519_t:CDS:2, partial [Cetraspora pellucida]
DCEKVFQSTVVRIKQRKKETDTFKCTNAVSVQKKLKTDEEIFVNENTIKQTLCRYGLR